MNSIKQKFLNMVFPQGEFDESSKLIDAYQEWSDSYRELEKTIKEALEDLPKDPA